jgi:hypothetical protein
VLEAAFDFVFPSTRVKFEDSDDFGALGERPILETHGLYRTKYICVGCIFLDRAVTLFRVILLTLTPLIVGRVEVAALSSHIPTALDT